MKTLAAVINGINEEYEFEQLTLGELQPDEVVVRIVATGICHSDEALRIGDAPFPMPVVLGHEGAGIIEKIGSAVKDFNVGDQVVMAYNYCGMCPSCRTGHPSSCNNWAPLNMGGGRPDGSYTFFKEDGTPVSNFFSQSSFATHTITNVNNLIKVDAEEDLRLIGPLGCGLLTGFGTVVNGLKAKSGSSIAVFGTGAVGLGALMTANIVGCSTIIAIDIHDSRLETAKELGATHTINSNTENLAERIAEITDELGVDYSIDTTGLPAVMKASIKVLGIGGISAPVAVTPHSVEFNTFLDLVLANRKLAGVLMGDVVPQLAIPELIKFHKEGKFPFERLLKFYKFSEINQAVADSNSGETIKPILIVDEEYRRDEPLA
ncbi:NAD(P)-dependent alcohol dehydrogenase [Sporosarcina pasteurii]|uniref:Aryl-alcohol dehydrogenase n=1 Tax=Sporosarcina pasteurii TaxID=1474 RepID=A0A380BF26_SPOPA|nr:NAD(P)-dependent alcohol dehydrogenase [Sporosarcina pasteurii]MDS9472587.1 NAD(P)-dependent alcohol dehydrogenase [Sporosarcina pasteurii]QBQ06137.1 NAD(P)-dependent alcohol dehydrogenase [Sporosarcina pasteurii]SUI99352.1 Aryl-alcohol dehydrogenase [Sporosarcina pasteurii]